MSLLLFGKGMFKITMTIMSMEIYNIVIYI